ncbi:MAG TPA: hypothetical protein VGJ33_16260 [Candidatus Angelobacter sp.]|jgi:hypothetical protein
MSVESAEDTVKWGLILAVVILLGVYAKQAGSSISGFLSSLGTLFGAKPGDPVAKIDPKTGLPIDPATGQADTGFPGTSAPTADQAAAIQATFGDSSGQVTSSADVSGAEMFPQGA